MRLKKLNKYRIAFLVLLITIVFILHTNLNMKENILFLLITSSFTFIVVHFINLNKDRFIERFLSIDFLALMILFSGILVLSLNVFFSETCRLRCLFCISILLIPFVLLIIIIEITPNLLFLWKTFLRKIKNLLL